MKNRNKRKPNRIVIDELSEATSTDEKSKEVVLIMNRHERRKQAAIERKRAKDALRDKKNKSSSNSIHGA